MIGMLVGSAAAPAPDVALVMMDTRDPLDVARGVLRPGFKLQRNASVYFFLTYYLNLRYATAHGYELLYYRMSTPTCQHPLWGARHPSYCKLTGIAHALSLRRHAWVVWVDSDAFVRDVALPLPALLRRYGRPEGDGAAAYFGWDSPYTLGPNAGFFALRAGDGVRAMLRTWWNVYSGQYGLEHSYEQHTMQWQTMHLDDYRTTLRTLSLRTMEPDTPDAVVHLDHNAGTKARLWIMSRAAAELLAPSAASEDEARWAKALGSLRQPWKRGRKQGRRTLELVLKAAARELLGPRVAAAPPPRAFDAAAGAALLALPAAVGAPALRRLPLHLVNCTADGHWLAPWQRWRAVAAAAAAAGAGSDGAAAGAAGADAAGGGNASGVWAGQYALAAHPSLCFGLGVTRAPKQPYLTLAALSHCSGGGGGGDGGGGGGGARRLAASSDGGADAAGALRNALQHEAASGHLRTAHKLRALRRRVPELDPFCGFWPNCTPARPKWAAWRPRTRSHLVLPKACWLQLGDDLHACADSEPVLMNLIRRGREVRMNDGQYLADAKPGWRRVAIGASGPVPEAALTMSPADQLCLTAWRSEWKEGAPAVWVNCPKTRSRNSRAAAKAVKAAKASRRAAAEAEAVARRRGASEEEVRAAASKAARRVVSKAEVKVSTKLHEEGFGAASHSSWDILPAGGGGGTGGGAGGGLVRIVPRSAPHMCLGAPPLMRAQDGAAARGAAGGGGAAGGADGGAAAALAHVEASARAKAARRRQGGGKGGAAKKQARQRRRERKGREPPREP